MSAFLEEYLDRGLSGIVVVEHDFEESASGHKEKTHEVVVARKGKGFVETKVDQRISFLGSSGSSTNFSEGKITESQYKRLSRGKEILDRPEAVEDIRRRKKQTERDRKRYAQFMETAPNCPNCKKKMVSRSGKYGRFWGCPDYPRCKGTMHLSPESQALYDRYAGK